MCFSSDHRNPQFGPALSKQGVSSLSSTYQRIAIARAEHWDVRASLRGARLHAFKILLARRSRTAHCSLLVSSIEPTRSLWVECAEYEECSDASAAKPLSAAATLDSTG